MANVFAPFGFRHIGYLGGISPTFAPEARKVSKSNATVFYQGDPVVQLNTGYITQATPGTTQIAGIFQSVSYMSVSKNGQTNRQIFWPGTDALNDGVAQYMSSPGALFVVQANAQATLAMVGENANFALGTGSTVTGQSGASLDISTVATTNTLPFRIVELASYDPTTPWLNSIAPGSNGSDPTTPYNYVYVTFNNQDLKSLTGI